jgi:hypothetical protein
MLIPTKLFTNLSCYIAMIISVNGLSASRQYITKY